MERRGRQRGSGRRRRRNRTNPIWIVVIVVAVAILIGGVIFVQDLRPEETDEWLCPSESGPSAGLAILLDLTDPLKKVQYDRVKSLLDRWVSEAEPNTLIAVGAVRPNGGERGIAFARCKPLEGKQANQLYENPRQIEERYQQEFRRPLKAIVNEMLNSPKADRSPIMESLQALLVGAPGFLDASYSRRVVIVSDLLQHSDAFSFYRGDNWKGFERSPHFQRVGNSLKDVKVVFCRIPRIRTRINMELVDDFWVNYFDRSRAREVSTSECSLGDL